ncbi:MAG: hypothetical protein KF745_15350 [Phycisphaeraceae bacterium]|nr:hypothetical protein [Phycisphaeraceae bacterium]
MRVYVDNQEIAIERPTLAAAVGAACLAAQSRSRVVVEAMLDGEAMATDLLDHPTEDERPDAEVRFVTAEPRSLVAVTLADAAEVLASARAEQQAAARAVQAGEVEAGLRHLASALAVWDQVRTVVDQGAALLGLDLATLKAGPTADGSSVSDAAAGLAVQLAEVKRSIEAKDWSGLADVLEYELDGQAGVWGEVLTGMARVIRPG